MKPDNNFYETEHNQLYIYIYIRGLTKHMLLLYAMFGERGGRKVPFVEKTSANGGATMASSKVPLRLILNARWYKFEEQTKLYLVDDKTVIICTKSQQPITNMIKKLQLTENDLLISPHNFINQVIAAVCSNQV